MNKYEKALLDLISWAEGTLGVSQNGYDITYNNYQILGWTPDTTITHGRWKFKAPSGKYTDAAGRYQFLGETWIELNGGINAPLTVENQDKMAIKLAKRYMRYGDFEKRSVKVEELVNKDKFKIMLNKLARVWASFILSSDITYENKIYKAGKGIYDKQGSSKGVDDFYKIYMKALALYT